MTRPDKLVAFHIGAHKTGTSVLQRYLRDNARALADQGILIPARRELGRYIGWGRTLARTPQLLAAWLDEFVDDPAHDILFASNENTMGRPFTPGGGGRLYPRGPRNIAALARATSGRYTPRVFVSIRPQAEFLESYYLQSVHEGGSATFEEWMKRVDPTRLSWRPIVRALNRNFGPDNVEVVDFRLIRHGQDAYVRRFLEALDPGFDRPVTMTAHVNRSISDKGLQLALAANPLLPHRSDRGALRRFLQEHFSNVDYPRPVLLSDADRDVLDARYGAEYDQLTGSPPQRTRGSSGPSVHAHAITRAAAPTTPTVPPMPGTPRRDRALARALHDVMEAHLDTRAERDLVGEFIDRRFGRSTRRLPAFLVDIGRGARAAMRSDDHLSNELRRGK